VIAGAHRSGYGIDPPGVQRPSLAKRVAIGIVLLIPLLAISVGLPEYALQQLKLVGASSVVTSEQVILGGVVLSVLWSLTYILRPTRAYGASGMARAVSTSIYFLLLSPFASVTLPLGGNLIGTIDYGGLLVAFAIIPLFSLVGAFLVLLSDRRDFDTRLRLEFPARWMGTTAQYVDPPTVNRAG
jgi:hypothetical protein